MASGGSAEGRLVKELDTLEMVLQAEHYEARGELDLGEFFRSGEVIQDPATRQVLEALKERRAARLTLAHLAPQDPPAPADLIVGFGVFCMSVPSRCADLYHRGLGPKILFTGGVGAGSGDLQQPEAEAFREHAMEAGVPRDAILVEPQSTNTLENVLAFKEVLGQHDLSPTSALLVALPHRQRRVWLTCRKQWPGVRLLNKPPRGDLDALAAPFGGLGPYTAELQGELDRIQRYGAKGDIERESR